MGSELRAQSLELVALGPLLALSRGMTVPKSLTLSVFPPFYLQKGVIVTVPTGRTVMRTNTQKVIKTR